MRRHIVATVVFLGAMAGSLGLCAQQWTIELDNTRSKNIYQCIAVDGGEAMLAVGASKLYDPEGNLLDAAGYLLKAWADGTILTREVGIDGNRLYLCAATELDDGNYMAFGYYSDSLTASDGLFRNLRVLVLDADLQTVAERDYRLDSGGFVGLTSVGFRTLRCAKAADGNVVLVTSPWCFEPDVSGGTYKRRFRFYEFIPDGDTVRTAVQPRYVGNMPQEGFYTTNIVPNPLTGGFTFLAKGNYKLTSPYYTDYGSYGVWNLSRDLEITYKHPVYFGSYPLYDSPSSIACEDRWFEGGLLLTSLFKTKSVDDPTHEGWLYMIDTLGGKHAHVQLPPTDSVTVCEWTGCGTAYVNDSTIFAVTCSSKPYIYSYPKHANVTIVDKDLNILGRKVLKGDSVDFDPPCTPVALNDGSVIIPCRYTSMTIQENHFMLCCFKREDIEITWDVVQDNATGTRLEAYPNPVRDRLHVPTRGFTADGTRLRIVDAGGATVFDAPLETGGDAVALNVSNLDPGMYVYYIVAVKGETIASGKFLKQ